MLYDNILYLFPTRIPLKCFTHIFFINLPFHDLFFIYFFIVERTESYT